MSVCRRNLLVKLSVILEKKQETIIPEWLLEARKTFKARLPYSYANKKLNQLVVYYSLCSCGADYISETIRNSKSRWNEHNTRKDKKSHCIKHLNGHFDYESGCFVLSRVSKNL